jgi:hypothetical protein
MAANQQQQAPFAGAAAIIPPDGENAARYLKASIERSFKGAPNEVKEALYVIAAANPMDFDRFASEYAQVVGKLAKVDLIDLNSRLGEFPYGTVVPATKPIEEFLAEKRVKGGKEITTLAAIVYEMQGTIIDVGKDENGRRVTWFEAKVTHEGVQYSGHGATKQLAAKSLFDDNEPIRGIPSHRSYEEPTQEDPANKQAANLYFQRIGKAVVIAVEHIVDAGWKATGTLGDVRAVVDSQPGKAAAKKLCTYALYNAYKAQHNVPDDEYRYIEGAPGIPGAEMETD